MASDIASENLLCELHLHLEGSVDPQTLRMLDPGLSSGEAEAPYRFTDFAGFIECFKFIALRLRTPEDYALITRRLVMNLAGQGVRYAEVTLSAGVLLWKGREIAPYYDAVRAATLNGAVEVRWILDAVRQFGPDPAWRVAEFAAGAYQRRRCCASALAAMNYAAPQNGFARCTNLRDRADYD